MNKVLVIIQRANGDVYLASPLINNIKAHYPQANIDLLINDDTLGIARTLANVNDILLYRYSWRKKGLFYRLWQELKLTRQIWKKYDVAITLTASDRSAFFAIIAGKMSIGSVEVERNKSWWKRKFLSRAYVCSGRKHMVVNNAKALEFLNAKPKKLILAGQTDPAALKSVKTKLKAAGVNRFMIYHPTAQYLYKVYPEDNRTILLTALSEAGINVIVTGTNNEMDQAISATIPDLPHIHNWMGKTSLNECIALTALSDAYVGMDTLNMHIAAAFDKPIFAIFGPTNPVLWSPWSNAAQRGASRVAPVQQYGEVTLFQGNLPCVACGLAGCDDNGKKSECLHEISPRLIFKLIQQFYANGEGKHV